MNPVTSQPIRVLHLTPVLSRRGGGAAGYLRDLVRHSPRERVRHWVAGTGDDSAYADYSGTGVEAVLLGRPSIGVHNGFSLELASLLRTFDQQVDLIHCHGVRSGIGLQALRELRRRPVPMLITGHGLHFRQLLQRRRLRKWIIEVAWDRRYQSLADCFHAASELEMQHMRQDGVRQPVAVVPIGVDAPDPPLHPAPVDDLVPAARGQRIALFMAILNPNKGADLLVRAWSAKPRDGWHLVIVGPDYKGSRAEVARAIASCRAGQSITLLDGLYGAEKWRLMQASSLFVLPTERESFGIVIGEALASGVPVITTEETPWRQLPNRDAGWCIRQDERALREALDEATLLPPERLREMGAAGRAWICSEFTWTRVVDRMIELYEWLCHRVPRPVFVRDG